MKSRVSSSSTPVRPNHLVMAGLFLLFFSVPVSISGMQIGLAVALLGMLWDVGRRRSFPRTPLDLPVVLFVGITFLSATMAEDPGRALRQFFGGWTIGGLYLVAGYTGDEGLLRSLLRLLFVPAAIVAAYGIFQHFTGIDFIRPGLPLASLELGGGTVYFPRGAFNHYQTFSNVFYLIFCLSFSMALHTPFRTEGWRWAIPAGLVGCALILSYTRGVWLATFFAAFFVSAFLRKRAFGVVAGAGLAATLVLMLSLSGMSSRMQSIFSVEQNVERFLLWETTWNMIRDHPRLGVGVGNYQKTQDKYIREEVEIPMTRTHSHNNLLQVTVERGIPALLILFWLWYGIVSQGFRELWKARAERGFSFALILGCLTGALGFFLDGMFQNNFGDTEVITLFWLMTGMLFRNGMPSAGAWVGRSERG